MRLAAILGACLLLPWPCAGIAHSLHAVAVWQSTQPQDQPSNSPPQSSPAVPALNQQRNSDQSPVAPPPPEAATPPCPENSQPGSTVKPNCKPAASSGAKTRKRHHKAAPPAGTPAQTGPTKTVVRNGGTADPTVDLSPGLSPQQASHQIDNTNRLLATSDVNLKKISGRQLSANQQDTVKQIKKYMEQAKTAADGGDVQRAYNLAVKANLLSTELAGH
jgi:hypothetical protein